jgi:putative spermidine/putrescine transport system substrate-binding protein
MRLGTPLVGAVIAMLAGTAAAQEKIVVTAYGGIWTDSVKKNFVSCFDKSTKAKAEVLTGESADWLARIRANPQNPPIHVVTLAEADSFRAAKEGLLDKITPEKVPNIKDVPDTFHKPWDDYSVVQNFGAMGVMYNKDAVKDPPRNWKDFIEAVAAGKFGKKVSMPAGTYTWGPEFIWLLSQQYGGNIDTAFEKLKAASKNVVKFWTTPVEALNLFGTHEVDVLVYWDGRSIAFMDKGNPWADFYIPEPSTIAGSVLVSKVKNAPDITWQYINCVLSPEAQLGHAETVLYAITNSKVVYPDSIKNKVTPASKVVVPPYDQIFDKIPGWIERWNKEMQ